VAVLDDGVGVGVCLALVRTFAVFEVAAVFLFFLFCFLPGILVANRVSKRILAYAKQCHSLTDVTGQRCKGTKKAIQGLRSQISKMLA
jgi:hypothetical protein